jgi:hypothetical protein
MTEEAKQKRIELLNQLRAEAIQTKIVVGKIEDAIASTRMAIEDKKLELKSLSAELRDAIKADAKAAVQLLRAEARARMLGLLN